MTNILLVREIEKRMIKTSIKEKIYYNKLQKQFIPAAKIEYKKYRKILHF